MQEQPTIITRGRITYILYAEKIVVGISENQWISYNQYDNWNRQGITQFKNAILNSREIDYTTASEQISLAVECGIRGTSTRRPEI